jgi:hypothetical protein
MTEQKFQIPTEMVDLPSKGLVYTTDTPLAAGKVELKYMTAKEEDILTNINYLRQGTAIEKTLKSLVVTPIPYDDLIIGDRNGLLIAARILAYGKDYTFKYRNPNTDKDEEVTIDLQDLKYKELEESLYTNKNEFTFTLPHSKNVVTFKLLTLADDKKIDEEIKNLKKSLNQEVGAMSMRLKYQITSINGDYSTKTVREFIDKGYLLSRDAAELRKYIAKVTPDIDTRMTITLSDGQEVVIDMPMTSDFFFPGIGI